MAFFMDGFDYYTGSGSDQLQSIWSSGSGIVPGTTGEGVYGYGKRTNHNGGSNTKQFSEVEGAAGGNWSTVYIAFHLLFPTLGSATNFLTIFDGTSHQLTFRATTDYKIKLYRGDGTTLLETSSGTFTAGNWYWIAIKAVIANTGGSCILNASGSGISGQQFSYSGDTAATANDYGTKVTLTTTFAATTGCAFDNFYLYDGADGAPFNAILSERRVYFGVPSEDGSDVDWTASAGNRWAAVDDIPPNGDTDYIHTSTVNHRYSAGIPDFTGITPNAVKLTAQARRDDAGASDIALFVKNSGGTRSEGSSVATGSSYVMIPRTMLVDPFTTVAWDLSDINAHEWGVIRKS